MDYLEGFLIGSIWSDTDYRSRRHFNAHILLAAAMAAAFMVLVLFPERRDQLIVIGWPAVPALLFLLIVLTPVLSIFYRRLPFSSGRWHFSSMPSSIFCSFTFSFIISCPRSLLKKNPF